MGAPMKRHRPPEPDLGPKSPRDSDPTPGLPTPPKKSLDTVPRYGTYPGAVRDETRSSSIGELARAAGVGVETIRFYERKGLIEQPPRPPAGARRYPSHAVDRVAFIQQAQELGFTLGEIKELLALRLDPGTSCAEVKARAQEKIEDIEAKVRRLRRMREALVEITKSCSGAGPTSECPILDYMAKPRPGRR